MEIITRQKTIEKISRRRDDFLLIEPKKLQTLPYSFRKNNSVSNLIWLCHNCHHLVHHYKNETKNFMVPVA